MCIVSNSKRVRNKSFLILTMNSTVVHNINGSIREFPEIFACFFMKRVTSGSKALGKTGNDMMLAVRTSSKRIPIATDDHTINKQNRYWKSEEVFKKIIHIYMY